MKSISDSTINEIKQVLDCHNGTLWESYNYELQDDGAELCIFITLKECPSTEESSAIKALLIDTLDARLPKREGKYSWIGITYFEGNQLDVTMGGMHGFPPR